MPRRLLPLLSILVLACWSISFAQEDKKKKPVQEEKIVDKKDDVKALAKGPFDHLKYRLIGPSAGGRVSRACGIPGDPLTYYLAAASGGVWKSSDAGLTWKSIFDDQPTSSIGALAVAPSDANVIYVGSGEANIRGNVSPGNGIYRSTDAGKTWKHVWKQKGQIGHIVVHPQNADIAYAAVLGSAFGPNPERGVYRTLDGGQTWKQVLVGDVVTGTIHKYLKEKGTAHTIEPIKEHVGAIDVCIDPNNPRILFAALWQARRTPWSLTSGGPGGGLYRSNDGGDTWKKLGPTRQAGAGNGDKNPVEDDDDSGLPAGPYGRIGVAVAPSDSSRVYALIEADKGGLYRSDDGGGKWALVNGSRPPRQRPWYFSTVHVDPKNPDIVWLPNVKLLRSQDGGKSFKNVTGPHHVDHHDLWIDPTNPKRMIDSNDGGVDLTTNGGASWHAPQLPLGQFYHITCDNNVPYRVLGNMQDQGTASGPSNSLCSDGISLSDWHTVGGGETGTSVADPKDPNIVYSGEYMGIITRYDQRTRQAQSISLQPVTTSGRGAGENKYRFQWTAPILISPHDHKTIYHGCQYVLQSTDAGRTWKAISPDLTRDDKSKQQWTGGPITGDNTGAEYYCTVFAIAESPKKAGVLWVGSDDGLVHVTQDGGKNWTNVTKNIPGLPEWGTVACIEASRWDPAVAYVVVDAHRLDNDRPYLWKTSDYGKTWQSLTRTLPADDYLRVVREDTLLPGLLFVGSEHGVSFSRHDGNVWEKLKLNLPTVAVSDLVVKGNDLVVGTQGRSIWILDDLTPLRHGKKDEASPRLFEVQPALRWRYHGGNYVGEDRIPGENPAKGALIHYTLDKKPKGDIILEVVDEGGKVLRKLTSKKVEPEEKEDDPDAPWSIYKPTVLPTEVGVNRVNWDLRMAGPTIIPRAKNDAGTPHTGPYVPPGTYTLRMTVDDKTLTTKVQVQPDPRLKESDQDLSDRLAFALKVSDAISRVSQTVIALQKIRAQIVARNALLEPLPDGKELVKEGKALLEKLQGLEKGLHNPDAEVAYDILARMGGAKLYSQFTSLYGDVIGSDGPVTQGMRDVFNSLSTQLENLEGQWRRWLREDLPPWNEKQRKLPAVLVP